MKLVLFDIDGTLLRCGRQGAATFLDCVREVFGHGPSAEALAAYSFGGRTDREIVLDLMSTDTWPRDRVAGRLDDLRRIYVERLEACLDVRQMRLLDGVVELLEELHRRDDLVLGLLTGNWRGSAYSKLQRFDLDRYFRFGAFADDGDCRNDLVPVALDRALEDTGRRFRGDEALIVGDTPRDIACARAHGCRVLAVATGTVPFEELEAAGADWTVPTLAGSARHPAFAPVAAP